jgi:hypothetical protein
VLFAQEFCLSTYNLILRAEIFIIKFRTIPDIYDSPTACLTMTCMHIQFNVVISVISWTLQFKHRQPVKFIGEVLPSAVDDGRGGGGGEGQEERRTSVSICLQ